MCILLRTGVEHSQTSMLICAISMITSEINGLPGRRCSRLATTGHLCLILCSDDSFTIKQSESKSIPFLDVILILYDIKLLNRYIESGASQLTSVTNKYLYWTMVSFKYMLAVVGNDVSFPPLVHTFVLTLCRAFILPVLPQFSVM